MKKGTDIKIYLADVLESVKQIQEYTAHLKNFEQFQQDRKTQDAVIRQLLIIGEAVKHLPDTTREKHASIPWKKIAGARDVFVHEYSGIELPLIWNIIENDLEPLQREIQKIDDSL